MSDRRWEWIRGFRLTVFPALCFLAVTRLPAQDPSAFLLPDDESVAHLLQAIDRYQRAAGTDDSFADPAYLIESLKRLETRLSEDPAASETLRLTLPLLYFRINQNTLAVRSLERFASEHPDSEAGRLLLVFGYLREEKYRQAKNLVASVVDQNPDHAYAHHLMGLSQLGLNELEGAVAEFERVVSLDPRFAESYFQLGSLQSKNRDTVEGARRNLEKALQLGLDRPEAHTRLGSVLIELGRQEEAIAELQKAVELAPQGAEAYYLLAEAYRKSNQASQAERALERFSELTAAEAERRELEAQGRTYFEDAIRLLRSDDAGGLAEASSLLHKTVEIFPGLAVAFYRLAQTELLLKRESEALPAIRRAIELNPLQAEYYFILSRCLENLDLDGAIEAIGKAISLDPSVADFHNLLGNLWFRRGDFRQSESAYRQATRLEPDNPAFHLNLSSALAKTGDQDASQKERELYLRLVQGRQP